MCTWSFRGRRVGWALGEAKPSGLTPPPPPRARPRGREEPSGDVAGPPRPRTELGAEARGRKPSSLPPGTQPNLASLLGSQTPPSLANSGRTSGGCRRPGPFPNARRAGGPAPRFARGKRVGPRRLRPNAPGPRGCPAAGPAGTRPHCRASLASVPGKPGTDPGPPNDPHPNLALPRPWVGTGAHCQPERWAGWSVSQRLEEDCSNRVACPPVSLGVW